MAARGRIAREVNTRSVRFEDFGKFLESSGVRLRFREHRFEPVEVLLVRGFDDMPETRGGHGALEPLIPVDPGSAVFRRQRDREDVVRQLIPLLADEEESVVSWAKEELAGPHDREIKRKLLTEAARSENSSLSTAAAKVLKALP